MGKSRRLYRVLKVLPEGMTPLAITHGREDNLEMTTPNLCDPFFFSFVCEQPLSQLV
jgi:hypothetical protein